MRPLCCALALLATLAISLSTLAMTPPMSEAEMLEASVLVVEGAITEVVCNGEPLENGGMTSTNYLATLTIESFIKPEESELETVTLPFAKIEYPEDSMPPSCAWSPVYSVGERGLYYLTSGSSSEFYTLVHWSGLIPDEDAVGDGAPGLH